MKVLNTNQIALLFFENRLKVAQRRLKKLCLKKKRIDRKQLEINQPYLYCLPDYKLPKQIEHLLAVNWMYVWFKLNKHHYDSIFHFSYEQQNEIFRYDGLIAINNKFKKETRFYFIEVDLSNNKFDKIKKYNDFYSKRLYENQWWVKYVERFPAVAILTHRADSIKRIEKKDNVNGLEFRFFANLSWFSIFFAE